VVQVRLIVEYDGSGFYGWQKQPELRTVQSQLQETLSLVLRGPVGTLYAAGRTDSGVHARGQVVTFFWPEAPDLYRLTQGVSHLLRGELAVVHADIVDEDFHPGFSSTHKQYSYRILNRPSPAVLDARRVWHIPQKMEMEFLLSQARELVGTHDFSSFRDSGCTGSTPVKTIFSSEFFKEGDLVIYRVIGQGFLKQMVRNIVGTITDMARGRIRERCVKELLAKRNRRLGGVTAPAHGLTMDWVSYDPLPACFTGSANE
jgi:tRNA pseudouridine38-40 synthase